MQDIRDPCPFLDDIPIPPLFHTAELSDLPATLQNRFKALPPERGTFLWGPTGTGKSHSTCCFAKERWRQGYDIHRTTYESALRRLKATWNKPAIETEQQVFGIWNNIDVLILEDIACGASAQESDFALRTLLDVLEWRLDRLLPVFVTSNKAIEQIAETYDTRIASRLCALCDVVRLQGEDRRMK